MQLMCGCWYRGHWGCWHVRRTIVRCLFVCLLVSFRLVVFVLVRILVVGTPVLNSVRLATGRQQLVPRVAPCVALLRCASDMLLPPRSVTAAASGAAAAGAAAAVTVSRAEQAAGLDADTAKAIASHVVHIFAGVANRFVSVFRLVLLLLYRVSVA